MADSKISALTAATTPLAGTEQIAIVQSATTKVATVLDIPNFANADLTFTGNRAHDTDGNTFELTTDAGVYGQGWLFVGTTQSQIGWGLNQTLYQTGSVDTRFNNLSRVWVDATETVVNDSGASLDFRVEGDTDANLLFADASEDFIGVGTNLPQAKVDIHAQGALSTDVVLNVRNSADTADILSINGDGSFVGLPCEFQFAVSDETSDLTTGTAKITFRMPYAMTLTEVRASVTTAPTGSAITVDINQTAATILSTKLTIDATEKTSTTAATPAVISTSALTDDAEITVDIDAIGSTIAGTGLKVTLIGTRA